MEKWRLIENKIEPSISISNRKLITHFIIYSIFQAFKKSNTLSCMMVRRFKDIFYSNLFIFFRKESTRRTLEHLTGIFKRKLYIYTLQTNILHLIIQ